MLWIILGFILLAGGLFALRGLGLANPRALAKWIRYGGAAILSALAAFLALTGRMVMAWPVAGWAWLLLRKQQPDAQGNPQHSGNGSSSPNRPGIFREEALEILGLQPGASEAAIHEAHRRLMQACHPDHGGSNYLAARLNAARDALLTR